MLGCLTLGACAQDAGISGRCIATDPQQALAGKCTKAQPLGEALPLPLETNGAKCIQGDENVTTGVKCTFNCSGKGHNNNDRTYDICQDSLTGIRTEAGTNEKIKNMLLYYGLNDTGDMWQCNGFDRFQRMKGLMGQTTWGTGVNAGWIFKAQVFRPTSRALQNQLVVSQSNVLHRVMWLVTLPRDLHVPRSNLDIVLTAMG